MMSTLAIKKEARQLFNLKKNKINCFSETDAKELSKIIYNSYHAGFHGFSPQIKRKIIYYLTRMINDFRLKNAEKEKFLQKKRARDDIIHQETETMVQAFKEWHLYKKPSLSMDIIDLEDNLTNLTNLTNGNKDTINKDTENDEPEVDENVVLKKKEYLEYRVEIFAKYPQLKGYILEFESYVQQYFLENYKNLSLEWFPINSLKAVLDLHTGKYIERIHQILMINYFEDLNLIINNKCLELYSKIKYLNLNKFDKPTMIGKKFPRFSFDDNVATLSLVYLLDIKEIVTLELLQLIKEQSLKYQTKKIMIIKFGKLNKNLIHDYLGTHLGNNLNLVILDVKDISELLYKNENNLFLTWDIYYSNLDKYNYEQFLGHKMSLSKYLGKYGKILE